MADNEPVIVDTPTIDEVLNKYDDDLKELGSDEKAENNQEAEANAEEIAEEDQQAEEGAQEDNTDGKEDDTEKEYAIDEIENDDAEEEQPKQADSKEPEQPKVSSNLTPEQQFIFDNLPVIRTVGKDGKTYDVKLFEQLPEDFEFANKRLELQFSQQIASQEMNARQLQQQYQQQLQARTSEEFNARENASIRNDIAQLQRDGLIPKFKADVNSVDFDKDAGVQLTNQVIEFMNKENSAYLDAYNKGSSYKHIGFREAYFMYKALNPTKSDPEQNAEDAQRREIAKKTTVRTSNREPERPSRLQPGADTRDLMAFIEGLDD